MEARGGGLQQLCIDGSELSDDSFRNFHKFSSLKKLTIEECRKLGPLGLRSIVRLKCLEWLKLRFAGELLPQDIIGAMEQSDLRCLTYLDMSLCLKLDDNSLLAIAKACPSLTSVRLERNNTNNTDDNLTSVCPQP